MDMKRLLGALNKKNYREAYECLKIVEYDQMESVAYLCWPILQNQPYSIEWLTIIQKLCIHSSIGEFITGYHPCQSLFSKQEEEDYNYYLNQDNITKWKKIMNQALKGKDFFVLEFIHHMMKFIDFLYFCDSNELCQYLQHILKERGFLNYEIYEVIIKIYKNADDLYKSDFGPCLVLILNSMLHFLKTDYNSNLKSSLTHLIQLFCTNNEWIKQLLLHEGFVIKLVLAIQDYENVFLDLYFDFIHSWCKHSYTVKLEFIHKGIWTILIPVILSDHRTKLVSITVLSAISLIDSTIGSSEIFIQITNEVQSYIKARPDVWLSFMNLAQITQHKGIIQDGFLYYALLIFRSLCHGLYKENQLKFIEWHGIETIIIPCLHRPKYLSFALKTLYSMLQDNPLEKNKKTLLQTHIIGHRNLLDALNFVQTANPTLVNPFFEFIKTIG